MGSLDMAFLTGFVCRVCSKMNRVVFHIHGEEGEKLNLANNLKNYLGLDLVHNGLPKTVCKSCISTLKLYVDYIELVKSRQIRFQDEKKSPESFEHNDQQPV